MENKIFIVNNNDKDDIKLFKDCINHKIYDISKYKNLS